MTLFKKRASAHNITLFQCIFPFQKSRNNVTIPEGHQSKQNANQNRSETASLIKFKASFYSIRTGEL